MDGLFINGGDQVRTFDALITFGGEDRQNSDELEHILERQQAGELVIGGTSAGVCIVDAAELVTTADTPFEANGVITHYLTEGDRFIWYPRLKATTSTLQRARRPFYGDTKAKRAHR